MAEDEVRAILGAARRHVQTIRTAGEAPNLDVLENMLLHLETSDDSFEKYELVKQCRRLAATCSEAFLETQTTDPSHQGEHEVVSAAVQKILASAQYADMKRSMLANTTAAANDASVEDIEAPVQPTSLEDDFFEGLDSDGETELDDLGESFLGLLPPGAELRRLVKSLGPQHPPATRIEALHALARLSPGDLVGSEHWNTIKTHFLAGLVDANAVVFSETLSLHLRLFNTGIHAVVREVFVHFVGHLQAMVRVGMLPATGPLDMRNEDGRRRTTQVAVLAAMAVAVPRYWVRMGDRNLAELMGCMLTLCWPDPDVPSAAHAGQDARLTPPLSGMPDTARQAGSSRGARSAVGAVGAVCRLLAVCDPRAQWLGSWMTGQLARAHVFDYFAAHPAALEALLATLAPLRMPPHGVINSLSRPYTAPTPSTPIGTPGPASSSPTRTSIATLPRDSIGDLSILEEGFAYSEQQLAYLLAMHNTCVAAELLLYCRGRSLISGPSAEAFLEMLAHLVCHGARSTGDPGFFAPGVLAGDLLRRTVSHSLPAQHAPLHPAAIAILLGPVRACLGAITSPLVEPTAQQLGQQESRLNNSSGATMLSAAPGSPLGKSPPLLPPLPPIATALSSTTGGVAMNGLNASSSSAAQGQVTPQPMRSRSVAPAPQPPAPPPFPDSPCGTAARAAVAQCEVLLDITDVFGLLAMSEAGRAALLAVDAASGQCLAEPVALLACAVLQTATAAPALAECLADLARGLLSVCRQLYSSAAGFAVLNAPALAAAIAAALAAGVWPDLLADSLLNFAWTPRGAALLAAQSPALLDSCALRMLDRFRAKLQVSKYEKFGYGVMVAELAASPAGLAALQRCGFVDFVLGSLRSMVVTHVDYPVPRGHTVAKDFRKTLGYAATVLTGAPAAHSLLNESSVSKAAAAAASTAATLRSLASPSASDGLLPAAHEPAALVRLRLLQLCCANLDSLVILDALFGLINVLLSEQRDAFLAGDTGPVMLVTPCTLLRNRILVSALVFGGLHERFLPQPDDESAMLFCAAASIPACYFIAAESHRHEPFLLQQPPSQSVTASVAWRAAAARAHSHSPAYRRAIGDQLHAFLVQACSSLSSTSTPPDAAAALNSTPVCAVAPVACTITSKGPSTAAEPLVERVALLAAAYAHQLGCGDASLQRIVSEVLVACRAALPSASESGTDWFAVVVALSARDTAAACAVLESLTHARAGIAWPQRAPHLQYVYAFASHWVGRLLALEAPLVAGALRLSGLACARVVVPWLQQCFLNVLDWPEVCMYVAGCVAEGPAFAPLFCVTILKHIQAAVLAAAQQQRLMDLLQAGPLDFALAACTETLFDLLARYRLEMEGDFDAWLRETRQRAN
jgi:hypothetical protein